MSKNSDMSKEYMDDTSCILRRETDPYEQSQENHGDDLFSSINHAGPLFLVRLTVTESLQDSRCYPGHSNTDNSHHDD
jgi:hypothetical protein